MVRIEYEDIVNNIKEIIEHKCFKQGAIAKKAGFTEKEFSDMLNNRKLIRSEHLPNIAYALDSEINELFTKSKHNN